MAEDFFADLSETISKTAKDISTKADSFFESQKIRTKILSEQRMIDKALQDMGNILYKQYVDGEPLHEELAALCEEITAHKVEIAKFREEVAKMRGQKVCAACGATVAADAAFCSQCGAPCEQEEEVVKDAPKAEEPEAEEEPAGEASQEAGGPEEEFQETLQEEAAKDKE